MKNIIAKKRWHIRRRLKHFFQNQLKKSAPKNSIVPVIPPFKVFQEAERMTPIAKRWKQDFEEAQALLSKKDTASLSQAYDLFTRSFPDSYVAAVTACCDLENSWYVKRSRAGSAAVILM
jgi:hypothetical protein